MELEVPHAYEPVWNPSDGNKSMSWGDASDPPGIHTTSGILTAGIAPYHEGQYAPGQLAASGYHL